MAKERLHSVHEYVLESVCRTLQKVPAVEWMERKEPLER
jgi:hypothetical protein